MLLLDPSNGANLTIGNKEFLPMLEAKMTSLSSAQLRLQEATYFCSQFIAHCGPPDSYFHMICYFDAFLFTLTSVEEITEDSLKKGLGASEAFRFVKAMRDSGHPRPEHSTLDTYIQWLKDEVGVQDHVGVHDQVRSNLGQPHKITKLMMWVSTILSDGGGEDALVGADLARAL